MTLASTPRQPGLLGGGVHGCALLRAGPAGDSSCSVRRPLPGGRQQLLVRGLHVRLLLHEWWPLSRSRVVSGAGLIHDKMSEQLPHRIFACEGVYYPLSLEYM